MINVLYIAGAGRSGSTLLERILGQIEGCVAVGELRHLWQRDPANELCGCGRLLPQCDFWRDVMGRTGIRLDTSEFHQMLKSQRRVDRMRYIPMMLSRSLASKEYARNHAGYSDILRCLYSAIHDVTNCEVIVDSSKDISTLYLLAEMADVRVCVLHFVRDSRAVAYSWTKKVVRPHIVDHTAYMHMYSPPRSAADWMYRNFLTELARGRTDDYLRLRYDDLMADPRGVTRQVASFMGLDNVDLSYIGQDEIKFTKESHAVAGNPMRFEKGTVRLRLDNAWQQEFSPIDKALVTALTWPLLQRYHFL